MTNLAGDTQSLWVATSEPVAYPPLDGAVDVDVAVVGAGIAGILTAAELHADGHKVALIEAATVGAGVTGYSTAKVTSQHGMKYATLARSLGETAARTYAEANETGLAHIGRLVHTYDIPCDFTRAPAYVFTTSRQAAPDVAHEAEVARTIGLPATFTTETDLPFPVTAAVRFDDQAHFHPYKFCQVLTQVLSTDGVMVYENTRVVGIDSNDPCRIHTDRGDLLARCVVITTGLPILDRGGHFATTHPERSYVIAVTLDGAMPTGMYISADSPTRSLRPALNGEYLLVGGEGHKVGQDRDEAAHYAVLESWAREHLPVREVVYRWSAQDYMPIDGVPSAGPLHKGTGRLLVATGFQKWGFTTAAVAARIIADHVVGRTNPWSELFDATRLPRPAGLPTFAKENANVGLHFFGDRIATLAAPSLDDVEPGQAVVTRVGGRPIAAYREGSGFLHAVSATCTHLGCMVAFNTAEQTWDCPCHGSRFDVDGQVLQGPATSALEPYDGHDGQLHPIGKLAEIVRVPVRAAAHLMRRVS